MNHPSRTFAMLILIAVLSLTAVGAASANGFTVGPLTVLSGPSPFATCTDGATGTAGETLM